MQNISFLFVLNFMQKIIAQKDIPTTSLQGEPHPPQVSPIFEKKLKNRTQDIFMDINQCCH